MSDVVLTIDGQRFSGWERLRISRGIAQVAGGFTLTLSERFDGLTQPRPIRPGQKATVTVDGHTAITGWVDQVSPNYDAHTHVLTVSGRDVTGDLVDCAAIHTSSSWSGRTLAQIAKDLSAPFKVDVQVLTDVGKPFGTWRIEPGETVIDNLDRAARYRGVLLISDGLGHLQITQPGVLKAPAALVLGQNIRAARGHSSLQQRFSKYIVKAQQSGSDDLYGVGAAAPSATVDDDTIGRYRPIVIIAEDQADAAACKIRAQWQRTVSAARGRQVVYTVDRWAVNDQLWQPNALVPVNDPFLGIDEQRLIATVDFLLDEQGRRTELTVVDKHAYDPIKLPQPDPNGGIW